MKPLLLHYFVTMRCNAACLFCGIWKEGPVRDAALPEVASNLLHARRSGCRFVDFTGGEPLLNERLPAFLDKAKKLGFVTSVTTNAILFPERAAELSGLIDLLHFSLDADTPELHDAIRGKRSYSRVIESIGIALRNRLVPDLLFTYTDENIGAFEGVWRLALEKKLMVILDPVFGIDGKDPCSPATHEKALAFAKRPGVYLNRALLSLRKAGGNRPASPLCRAVDSTVVILPDNRLALPCFHHRTGFVRLNDDLDKTLIGGLRKEAAARQGRYPFCEGCHINCYFDPSFAFLRNRLSVQSATAKLGYAWRKYVRYRRPLPFPRKPAD